MQHSAWTRALMMVLAFAAGSYSHAREIANTAIVESIIERIDDKPVLILGELHGSVQAPELTAALVERLAAKSPVLLGLEIYAQEQQRSERFLESSGDASARDALLAGEFWQRPRETSDGRRSRAMFALLDRVRALRQGGLPIDVVAYDDTTFYGTDRDRDALMARRLRATQLTHPDARLIVLTGNYHARMSPPENLLTSTGKPFADPPTPMAMHLADITGMSIDISAYGGMAWACINMHCGPRALALRSATPPESATLHELVRGQDGYDLRVIYPLMTASEPMPVTATGSDSAQPEH